MPECFRTDCIPSFKNKKIFFDANIWIYIFCELANSNIFFVRKYSKAFSSLLKSKNTIFTDLTIMSEFVNRYLRIAFTNYKNANNLSQFDYKRDYRKTDDFKEAWKTVCSIVNMKILSKSEIINFEYDKNSLKELLNIDETKTDFNDNHIVKICKTNDMYLLTNDSDFKNTNIKIISENKKCWNN